MLIRATELKGYAIRATDGNIGSVSTVYFDDDGWTVRYLVVDTGTWLPGRKVLISPVSIRTQTWMDGRLDVALTRDQVKNSPDVDTEQPVSRQHERRYSEYYGYPQYWGGAGAWGAGAHPAGLATAPTAARESADIVAREQANQDAHLRDASAVKGYHVEATDGEIGHVDDFLIDAETWSIRYLVVDTSNWLGGRHVLVAPEWVTAVSWDDSRVRVRVTRQRVEDSPEYDPAGEVNREYEQGLYVHYGQTAYWSNHDVDRADPDLTGRKDDARDDRAAVKTSVEERLARLEDVAELEVADEQPDVRGWNVVASDGVAVGNVEHLIVDRAAQTVSYLEVGLLGESARQPDTHDVLIPLDQVRLDESREEVRLLTLSSARIVALPVFRGLPLEQDFEQRLRTTMGQQLGAGESVRYARLRHGSDTSQRQQRREGQVADRARK